MVVPNHTCLKLKMPGLKWVITVEGSFEQAYYYEQDCITKPPHSSPPVIPMALATT